MAIVRWEPFRDLMGLQERMNRLFDESFRGIGRGGADDDWALGGSWAPAVDIYHQDSNIVLKAEVPGMDPKDVDIRVENNVLTPKIQGKAVNLSGFFIIVAVTLFGALLGVLGALTAVPLAATIQILVQELTKARRARVTEARELAADVA